MLRQQLEQFEATQKDIEKVIEDRKQGTQVLSNELLENLADKCAGVRKVYGDYDRRRASRPYQMEDYCLEKQCRYRRDKFSTPSECQSCRSPLTGCNTCSPHSTLLCQSCTVVEACPPSVPCQDRFRRNVISTAGTWKRGYEKQQERHHLLVSGSARDLVIYKTLAIWKQELDKRQEMSKCGQ